MVDRYDWKYDGMYDYQNGAYVDYDDYAALQAENERLKASHERLLIPADQWPEGAVALMWSSEGVPLALHHGDVGDHEPWWVDGYTSKVMMPEGHDWRVPVMRPHDATEDDRMDDLLDELRDVEDYFKYVDPHPIHLSTVQAAIDAFVAMPKPAPAIDLEQLHDLAHRLHEYPEDADAVSQELLALIDAHKGE